MKTGQIILGDITVDVVFKRIKNLHLRVLPPTGRVRISAPLWMRISTIRMLALSKLDWIKKQQTRLERQTRRLPATYRDRDSHYLWGRCYSLLVIEGEQAPTVELSPQQLVLRVRPGSNAKKRQAVVEAWYRSQLRKAVLPLVTKWEPLLGVRVKQLFVRRMKTRWGSCNPSAGHIRLNTELARKKPELLEYVVVHELIHLLERSHNARFRALMDRFLPSWQSCHKQLELLPTNHEE